jgi:hypothetical protein
MVASPAGRISGRIVTSNGTPAPAGTMVSLSIDVMDSPHWSGVTTEKAVTDADGKYAFGGLMGGTSSITLATGTGVSITPILKNMHVNAGREITIPDISLSQGGIISGRVLFKKTKEPIPGVNISVATVTTTTDRRVQEDTDLNGTFAINMLPGVYTI